MSASRILAATFLMCAVSSSEAQITSITIERSEPFLGGLPFGAIGAYERLSGTAHGELDPDDPGNHGIVNLDRAPKNARGRVEYSTDIYILRPRDPALGNHEILYEVVNRGKKFLFPWLMDASGLTEARANEAGTAIDVGDALFLRQGYTLVWSGWDADASRANGGLSMNVPLAMDGPLPVVGSIREELVSGTRAPAVRTFHLTYPAVDPRPSEARLTVRVHESDPREVIDVDAWTFIDSSTIALLPEGKKPSPGALYELHYRAERAKIEGIGFAATRDFVSYLRHQERAVGLAGNMPPEHYRAAIAVGISQSGRYLRDFVDEGFNRDLVNARVFDGVLTHISGVGRVFLNEEFAEAFRTNTQHEDHAYPENSFPFAAVSTVDARTGLSGAILHDVRFDPLLIETNTSTEYWQKGASLLTTDTAGVSDLPDGTRSRVYLIAGTQHAGRAGLVADNGPCANPRNPHSPAPALRALVVALNEWVIAGTPAPLNRVPSLEGGTLVRASALEFPEIPGIVRTDRVNALVPVPDWTRPPEPGTAGYPTFVTRVDADGNEVAGILLPDVAVPLGTFTGWNVYRAPYPEGDLCDRDGSYSAFAASDAARRAASDPRASIETRYASEAAYLERVEQSVNALVAARLLLPEDGEAYVNAAHSHHDLWPASAQPQSPTIP